MKLLLILVMIYVQLLFHTIDSKLCRILVDDNILPYFDKSIPFISDFFSLDNFTLEQIDDDNVQIGGYLLAKKSMDPNFPLVGNIRTQIFEKATWNEGAFRMTMLNMCDDLSNPIHAWYNVTKLWSKRCPVQIGDKWETEPSQLNIIQDIPPTVPLVPWRLYVLVSHGIPGFELFKVGYGLQIQFLPI